jgi:hypothetical protein
LAAVFETLFARGRVADVIGGKYNVGLAFDVDRNNWGCATSRAFREVACRRDCLGELFHHRWTVCAVTAPKLLSSCSIAMRRNLKRYYGAGDLHFITCSCYRRQPWLGTARRRDLFLTVVEQVRKRYQFVVVVREVAHPQFFGHC